MIQGQGKRSLDRYAAKSRERKSRSWPNLPSKSSRRPLQRDIVHTCFPVNRCKVGPGVDLPKSVQADGRPATGCVAPRARGGQQTWRKRIKASFLSFFSRLLTTDGLSWEGFSLARSALVCARLQREPREAPFNCHFSRRSLMYRRHIFFMTIMS